MGKVKVFSYFSRNQRWSSMGSSRDQDNAVVDSIANIVSGNTTGTAITATNETTTSKRTKKKKI